MSNILLKLFTQEQKAHLKEYFLSEERELVNMYFAMSPDKPDPDIPFLTERQVLLRFYSNLSEIYPWFDKELLFLLKECKRRADIVPDELKQWLPGYALRSAMPAKRTPSRYQGGTQNKCFHGHVTGTWPQEEGCGRTAL